MEFEVKNTAVYGMDFAFKASGNPMRTVLNRDAVDEKDVKRSISLASTKQGEGHDNFLKGIIVQFDVIAPLYWWKHAQRYHWLDFISSQSTMHSLLKFKIETQCVSATNPQVIKIVSGLVDEYNALNVIADKEIKWKEIVASLPCGFCLGASMTTNYQQLKTIYFQRRNHKLEEWHIFCTWIEELPMFKELIGLN
ncbi:MAG: hypothetical protein RR734_01060 [Bacilli bacterium]